MAEAIYLHFHRRARLTPARVLRLVLRAPLEGLRELLLGPARFMHVDISFAYSKERSTYIKARAKFYSGYRGAAQPPAARISFGAGAIPVYDHAGDTHIARGVICSLREHANRHYTTHAVTVPAASCAAAFEFLVAQADKPSVVGLTDTFALAVPPRGYAWFCVQLVVAALQQAGLMRGYNPSELTADELWLFLHVTARVAAADNAVLLRDAYDALV